MKPEYFTLFFKQQYSGMTQGTKDARQKIIIAAVVKAGDVNEEESR